jgi:hypothetical protein
MTYLIVQPRQPWRTYTHAVPIHFAHFAKWVGVHKAPSGGSIRHTHAIANIPSFTPESFSPSARSLK